MADIKEYAYYIRGRDIAIVEVDTTTLPNTTFQGDSLWKSPQSTINDGLLLAYTAVPKAKDGGEIADESDDIDISDLYAKAVVYYVKARLAEDAGQIDLKEYNMKEFYRLAHKSKTSREYGPTIVIPGSHAIR